MTSSPDSNGGPAVDSVLTDIADYVLAYDISDVAAYRTARYSVIDALGCAIEALNFHECTKLLGPTVPGSIVPHGARVPGTQFELDPVSAAFNIGTMIRWLDFNDSISAAQGGHPSDNLGGILATADYLSRKRTAEGKPPLLMRDVLIALIKAYEIQGVLSLENSFTRLGFDPPITAKIAATAVVTSMLGGGRVEIVNAVSNAWADGVTLKIFRQGASTGTRKSWAGADAASRAVWLALMALKGEMGYPRVLTMKTYGFYDTIFQGRAFEIKRAYGCYVMENVIYKLIPGGLHAQSAAECAFKLHPLVTERIDDIATITIYTHQELLRVMDKQGPLTNPADRDHCAQYVVAVALIHGKLSTADFEDEFAADPRIDQLRAKMTVVEDPRYTRDRLDPDKRSNAAAIEAIFRDGSSTPKAEVEYPLGHPRRRAAATPLLESKFRAHIARRFAVKQQSAILDICMDQIRFESTPVDEFMSKFVT